MRSEEEIRQAATIIREMQPENRRDASVLEWVLGGPAPNKEPPVSVDPRPSDIPARVLKVVGLAAMVAMYQWGTSVSEGYHNERVAAMERLRAALPSVDNGRL